MAAFKAMLLVSPTMSPDDPLLLLPGVSRNIVTVGKLKTVFRALIKLMGHQPSAYSLHSLRRTGATLAYEAGVDYLSIIRHGTWRSGAFWEYITTRSTKNSKVASSLANIVKGHKHVLKVQCTVLTRYNCNVCLKKTKKLSLVIRTIECQSVLFYSE